MFHESYFLITQCYVKKIIANLNGFKNEICVSGNFGQKGNLKWRQILDFYLIGYLWK